MLVLILTIYVTFTFSAGYWLYNQGEVYSDILAKRIKELGIPFTVPMIGRVWSYPDLMIRLGEEHLSGDPEACILISRLKEAQRWKAVLGLIWLTVTPLGMMAFEMR
jgi:hypothetical protein